MSRPFGGEPIQRVPILQRHLALQNRFVRQPGAFETHLAKTDEAAGVDPRQQVEFDHGAVRLSSQGGELRFGVWKSLCILILAELTDEVLLPQRRVGRVGVNG